LLKDAMAASTTPAPVRKFGGTLVHFVRDAYGSIEVVDAFGVRTLHFGTPARQSAMCLQEPDRVELPYVRAMLSALLFQPEPSGVLLLGLGGGSLAKALFQHVPACRIDVVERRGEVVEVAHRFFGLPVHPRLSITVGDAGTFVKEAGRLAAYDLILADLFDGEGMASPVAEESFYFGCASALRPAGVFGINLWGSQTAPSNRALEMMRRAFGGPTFRLAVPARGNLIGFSLASEPKRAVLEAMEGRARRLEARLGIEFGRFLRVLKASGRAFP
jgi:spermidine synthase